MKKIIVVLAIIFVGLGAYALLVRRDKPVRSTNSTTSSAQAKCETTEALTVLYCDSGFSAFLNIIADETVVFKNNSKSTVDIESDPHPAHSENPELNIGKIEPGQSKSVKLKTLGSWHFHNELKPADTGEIDVLDDL